MTSKNLIPVLSSEQSLTQYLFEIRQIPMLKDEEEVALTNRFYYHQDLDAAHRLVKSHLRLVAKIAFGYKGYGLPMGDMIAEGNIGLMQAVKKFDPTKGFRLATYAMWWIKASIQEHILKSWSLVKVGTTAAQKKLFFNLKKLKSKLGAGDHTDLSPENTKAIAQHLDVSESEVTLMNRRMIGGDHSLNVVVGVDGQSEFQDFIEDETQNQEALYAEKEETQGRRHLLAKAFGMLNTREQAIFKARRLQDDPLTLEELSAQYSISRERVRQIEARAFEKVQQFILGAAPIALPKA